MFTLKSNELGGQLNPHNYAESGNLSPQLYWENAPEGTQSFAVTMYDLDAPTGSGFWHWVVFNIPASVTKIAAATAPAGAIESNTDMGTPGYAGAAPPPGPAHRYVITVHALSTRLELGPNTTPAYVGFNLHFTTLAKASLLVYGQKQ